MANKKTTYSDKAFVDFESDIIAGIMAGKPLGGTGGVLTDLIIYVVDNPNLQVPIFRRTN